MKRLLARVMLVSVSVLVSADAGERLSVYTGTYTGRESKGIYLLHLDVTSGKLQKAGLAAEVRNPSFLAFHPNRPFLYSVGVMPGGRDGALNAFAIDATTGKLTVLNRQSSRGNGPCHVAVDRTGSCALVANYGSGSVACLPIREDGRLGAAASFHQHTGSSVNQRRQKGPHAHSVNVDPANRFAVVADLGIDKVLVYKLDAKRAILTPNDPPGVSVEAGAGPRHFSFHPSGRSAYVINELHSTVTAFRYDAGTGVLTTLQTIGTLPKNFEGTNTTAEVLVHPSGKFLYGSNRGHDSITAFAIDSATGTLKTIGCVPCGGKWPRNFGIDPTGRFLLVANRNTNNVAVFRIDQTNGALTPTGHAAAVPAPVCVRFPPVQR